MGVTVVTSAAGHHRIARGRDWLKARAPAEEILIIGATLSAANELTRTFAREKRASFGHHRVNLGQLASALARPALSAQRTVPLGALPVQAVANRAIHKLSEMGELGRYAKLTSGPGFARAIANVIIELRLEQAEPDALVHVAPDLRPLLQMYEGELKEHMDATSAEIDAAVTTALDALKHPLMQRAAKAQVLRRETPLQHYREDGTLIEGVVDLAFQESTSEFNGWTVVDFKTDREIEKAEDQYRNQVAAYVDAIQAATVSSARGFLLVI